jgi:subtilisin family serine protease
MPVVLRPLALAALLLAAATASTATTTAPRVVVQLATGASIGPIAAGLNLTVLDQLGSRPIHLLGLPAGTDPGPVVEALRQTSGVVLAEDDAASVSPEATKNSVWAIGGDAEQYAEQWAPTALRLPEAHARSTGAGVRVAVLDTGVDLAHPALAGRFATVNGAVLGRDFVDGDNNPSEVGSRADLGFGHGTHVAGLVALAAPGARLMPVRVLNPQGGGTGWALARGLLWAVDPDGQPGTDDGAHLINLSLGSTQPTQMLALVVGLVSCNFEDDDDDFDHPGFRADVQRCARRHSAAVLAAAGNGGSGDERWYPAAEELKGSRAIGAGTQQGTQASFSNYGGWIKLAAPGDLVTSTVPGGGYGVWSGTSMAAPLATGAAALVMATRPPGGSARRPPQRQWLPEDVMKRLEDRSAPLCNSSLKAVDAAAAVTNTASPGPNCP